MCTITKPTFLDNQTIERSKKEKKGVGKDFPGRSDNGALRVVHLVSGKVFRMVRRFPISNG